MASKRKLIQEKTGGFLGEFKQFIARGNVIDMAVGVIIGGAFGKISTSLVNDILMPVLSLLTGGIQFDDWKMVLREAVMEEGEVVSEAVTLNYGTLLSAILNFLIVAFAVFLMIKAVNAASGKAAELARLKKEADRKAEEAAEEAEKPSKEELLLMEIRDLLKGGIKTEQSGKPQSGKPSGGQGKKRKK